VFHDGTDVFGGFLTNVILEIAKIEKWAIIRQIRSGSVGVPCKKAPGLWRFMDMVFGVSWGVFLSGRRRYGRFWPFACPGVSWGLF
jgi:hypothetical protein